MRRVVLLLMVVGAAVLLATGVALAQATPARNAADSPSFRSEGGKQFAPDQIIVKLKERASSRALEELNRRNGASTKKKIPGTRLNVVKLPQGLAVEEAVRRYGASSNVEYAEPDYLLFPTDHKTPNDTSYNKLWGLHNTGQDSGTADADIDAPEAWHTTTGNEGTVVAVIDTGVDYNHPDLKNNIWVNTDEIAGNKKDDDNNGYVDDVRGWDCRSNDNTVFDSSRHDKHGTHVAGTIAAEGNNGSGVVGVNWDAQIMPLKFLGPAGGYTSDAVECLNYAVKNGAKISNNSWGGGGKNQALEEALSKADGAGHLFVAAAGNEGEDNDSTPSYPSSYGNPNVVAVAATDRNDALASFSNYGKTSVDLAAPGVSILSTLPGKTYGSYSGTSMATPHVAGVAALIKSKDSTLDDDGMKSRLLKSVDKEGTDDKRQLESLAGKMVTEGRLNAAGALTSTGT